MASTELTVPDRRQVATRDRVLRFCQRHDEGVDVAANIMLVLLACALIGLVIATSVPGGLSLLMGLSLIGTTTVLGAGCGHVLLLGKGDADRRYATSDRYVHARVDRRLGRARSRYDKQIARLDATEGWRPRAGALHPVGRDDRHDRYRVQAEVHEDKMVLSIVRWRCGDNGRWSLDGSYRYDRAQEGRRVIDDPDDDEAFTTARDELNARCAKLEHREGVSYAEAIAERQMREERQAALALLAQTVNAEPSI